MDCSLQIRDIIPAPLEGSPLVASSDIWGGKQTFESGKNYLVSAPSGTGKSTFLHILYGLRSDYSGQTTVYGKPAVEMQVNDWAALRREHLSMVFQDLRLFLSHSLEENIEIKRMLTEAVTADRARDMADQLGIASLWDKPVETLSYGQRQRAAIVRALCQPFDWLLLDEPFSHLDEDNIALATALIEKRCAENQAGLILVSLGEAYAFKYDNRLML